MPERLIGGPLGHSDGAGVRRRGFELELRLSAGERASIVRAGRAADVVRPDGSWLYWSGRIDDAEVLRGTAGVAADATEPEIVAAVLERYGTPGLDHVFGSWALVWTDAAGGVHLARDPMGHCPLMWASVASGAVVTTDWESAWADPRWSRSVRDETLAAFFSVHLWPESGETFFEGLNVVPPGCVVTLAGGSTSLRRVWEPATEPEWDRREDEAEERYRELFGQAVAASVADATKPAILLSSGLDSSRIAAWLAHNRRDAQAISWSVESVPEVDETPWIRHFVREVGLSWEVVSADGVWPLHPVEEYLPPVFGPLSPALGGFRRRAFTRAAERGVDVALTGDGADLLYLSHDLWLTGLVRRGEVARAGLALARVRRESGLMAVGRVVARQVVPMAWRGATRHGAACPWLTPEARSAMRGRFSRLWAEAGESRLLAARSAWADLVEICRRPELDGQGIDVRHPFRNRRLVEYFLTMPPHLLFQPGQPKRLARRAWRGMMPDAVLDSPRRGRLLAASRRFLVDSLAEVRAILDASDSDWQRWVRRDWMNDTLEHLPHSGRDGAEWIVVWNCVMHELWQGRLNNRLVGIPSPVGGRHPRGIP
jgi:asparagine synthase (glutamine-hydrolysing)